MADDWATAVDVQEGINQMKVQPSSPAAPIASNEQQQAQLETAEVVLDPFTDEPLSKSDQSLL